MTLSRVYLSYIGSQKMNNTPSKQRFIAASHSCTTKPLSKMITFCLKLIQTTCIHSCKVLNSTRGFNRMWIVNNSVEVLDQISGCNKRNKVRNVRTYDFSTLYTSIPHKSVKEQLTWVIAARSEGVCGVTRRG